jgi:transcriptional regulator
MYIPPSFAETDLNTLHDFIESHSFGVLISQGDEPAASHLPFLLDRQREPLGRLIGHMARANPQWREADGRRVLAIFSGPHAYISPSWYEAEQVVPTWNYVAVHVYGTLRLVNDDAAALQIVRDMVARYERGRAQPWRLEDDAEFLGRMVKAIVGFHIDIDRIEGKWKLSQNHPPARRERVSAALLESGDPAAIELARLM